MSRKKLAATAAFTAALAAGGAAGALFATPGLTGAQESDSGATDSTDGSNSGSTNGSNSGSTTDPNSDPTSDSSAAKPLRAGMGEHFATAAELLGITAEELRAELRASKSIADVAEEKGVDKQKIIDALVASATARIDEMKAALPERIAELVERDGLPVGPGGPGRHHRGHRGFSTFGLVLNSFDDAATALGIPVQELRTELAAGKSIATIASEKGKSLDDVKAAMVADANARVDRGVERGELTAEEGADKKADFAARVDELLDREGFPIRDRLRGPRGPWARPTS